MKYPTFEDAKIIKGVEKDLSGVFLFTDLQILLDSANPVTLNERIKRLERADLLKRFKRGTYIAPNFSAEVLSAKIEPSAYISMATILSQHGLIGVVPERRITAVKIGRNRRYISEDLVIEHLGIAPHLYFGYDQTEGVRYANREKAYLDTLYYFMRGRRFAFNPLADIDVSDLDSDRLNHYLKEYRNKRFVTFCERSLNAE